MATLNEKLQQIKDIKANIKDAIIAKGATVTDFASYSLAIADISTSSSVVKEDKDLYICYWEGTRIESYMQTPDYITDDDVTNSEQIIYSCVGISTDDPNYISFSEDKYTYCNGNSDDTFTLNSSIYNSVNELIKDATDGNGIIIISNYSLLIDIFNTYNIKNVYELSYRIEDTYYEYGITGDEPTEETPVDYGTCDLCGTPMDENGCPNVDCPNSYNYEAPEETTE